MSGARALGVLCIVLASRAAGPAGIEDATQQSGASPATQASTFPSRVDLITLDAVVVDAQGHPVPGLTQSDFTIEEDGRSARWSPSRRWPCRTRPMPPGATSRLDRRPWSRTWCRRRRGTTFLLVFDDIHLGSISATTARTTWSASCSNRPATAIWS